MQRFGQLDAVRAAAIGMVFVEHFAGATIRKSIPIGAGFLGVGLFFTLSGFLITSILMADFEDRRGGLRGLWPIWRDFYVRRLLRLAPAYYAVLLALVLFGLEPVASSWPWHAAYLSNVWISLGNPILDFWSLAVEEQFYVFWPFVIAFTPRRYLGPVILASTILLCFAFKAAVLALGVPQKTVQTLLFANLGGLGCGALLAWHSFRDGRPYQFGWYRGPVVVALTAAAWAALAAAVAGWFAFEIGSLFRYYFNELLCSVFFAWVVLRAAIGFGGAVGWVFDHPAVQYVGRISYGLYLVHNWVPKLIEQHLGPMPKALAAPLVLAIIFAVCALSWHFYEQPILRLRRRWTRTAIPVSETAAPRAEEARGAALAAAPRAG